ncbi:MAG: thiamine phosphate synthase [Deltaproteobacteria bacterium]|nr:thiamine phosphate synthase [Deltaproteobacteria bacterium]
MLYLITDGSSVRGGKDLVDKVIEALKGGVKLVQLREKDLGGRQLLELALRMRSVTRGYGARLLINDRVDVALLSDADGVHLGQSGISPYEARKVLGEARLIGVSAHSLKEAVRAEEDGADFVTFGPVYRTPSKAGYGPPVGLPALKDACSSVNIPLFAIGGVKAENVKEALAAGAFGAAVISYILASADAARSARDIIEEMQTRGAR